MFFAGFPVWWVLGLTQVAIFLSCAVMIVRLVRWRHPVAPRGFRLWVIFLLWAALGVFVLQAEAPGAAVGGGPGRYLSWGLRLVWYLEATVVLLYVANIRKSVGTERLARIFAVMFVIVTVGGLIGSMTPMTSFRSLVEYVLPTRFSGNAFLSSLVHPIFAERRVYLGNISYRPSAPFPYANEWGLNYACFLPIFVYAWLRKSAGWRRFAAPIILLASLVPVIYSFNRGLWVVLVLLLIVTILKQARAGNLRPLIVLTIGALVVAVVVALSPLGNAMASRFSGHNSNGGRATLSLSSVASVAQSSPVIGLGTTRHVQGSFYSIAGGSTPDCPSCSPPSFGTQGVFWSFLFQHGLVGGGIGLAFFVLAAWRHRRRPEPAAVAYLCTLLAFLLTVPIYDWSETASFAVMAAIASLGSIATDSHGPSRKRFLPEGLQPIRGLARPRLLLVCCVIGGISGAGWQAYRGSTYLATAAVYLPDTPKNSGLEPGAESTLDTQARMIASLGISRPTHHKHQPPHRARDNLTVSAVPNSRIINVTYRSANAQRAVRGATYVSQTAVRQRSERLRRERAALLANTNRESNGVSNAIATIDARTQTLGGTWVSEANAVAVTGLRHKRGELEGRATQLRRSANMLAELPVIGGQVVHPASVRVAPQRWNVAIVSGVALGFLAAVLITDYRWVRGVRLARLPDIELRRALKGQIILRLDAQTGPTEIRWRLAAPSRVTEALCVGPCSTRLGTLTEFLNEECTYARGPRKANSEPAYPDTSVIAVASTKIRTSRLVHEMSRLQNSGIKVAGIVVARR
jgi:hypothetical protein